ncbi:DUF2332 domain-containing protein [Paracoccus laeviglucosivorans]|uniref:DUF2332 domain-containing protein n=1 Tax=Paracoccus laeviglucosivorans TaxID=1197861 RepID=A0A521BQ21_9RHOB|nr:DUF2332 family protein [Paracoccus laeviglucosivorans]SMO49165.1 hypothetical protein SAMN06265221_10341 [Paracoccus laeviglucosivorans]
MSRWSEAFAMQAKACRALGSDLTARVCESLAELIAHDPGPIGAGVRDWQGDPTYHGDSVPLRLCGALHGLVLAGDAPGLADAYAGHADLDSEIFQSIQYNKATILEWLKHPPQTNEVARSAVLIAAGRFLGVAAPGVRFDLLELGASAGLNLNFPLYTIAENTTYAGSSDVVLTPQWRSGRPPAADLAIGSARGVDINPLDPQRDGLRLMAYIWPDQRPRLERMRAALEIAGIHPPQVDRDDAGAWLGAQLAAPAARLVYHTVAAQYFPAQTRTRVEDAMQDAATRATAEHPLAHFSMETDGTPGTALRLRLWDGNYRAWDLGRADAHARWIDWQPKESR